MICLPYLDNDQNCKFDTFLMLGNNRVPIQDCAQSYIRALKVFEWKVSRGSLRLVRFVDTDSKVIDAIRQELDAEWDKPYDFVGIDPWHNIIDIITSGRDTTCATSNIQELSTSDKGNICGWGFLWGFLFLCWLLFLLLFVCFVCFVLFCFGFYVCGEC